VELLRLGQRLTVLGETEDAARAYPRALAVAVPMVRPATSCPSCPPLAAGDWTTWREGGWPEIASATAGAAGPALARSSRWPAW
jgi:hypothetical protein